MGNGQDLESLERVIWRRFWTLFGDMQSWHD